MIWNPWKEIKRLRAELNGAVNTIYHLENQLGAECQVKVSVLKDIIAEEKPTSNATVRRMARIAREAL